MRKLGKKNGILFAFMIILSLIIIAIFSISIFYASKMDTSTYDVSTGSIIYDDDFLAVEVEENSKIKKGFDNSYYLIVNNSKKMKIGNNVVVYNPDEYKMNLVGSFYQVLENGEVLISPKFSEVDKAKGPYFFKISDRKYLWIDSSFVSNDGSFKTKDYLIIELDKMGNATLANHEIMNKTVNPLIINGSKYSFDVANERLIVTNNEIDLKNIIGSSNMYEEKIHSSEDNYYDSYLETLVNHFNDLTESLENTNEKNQELSNSQNSNINLSKWVSLGIIENGVSSIKINYNVFDPNNEYESIFIVVNNDQKIYLNKESNFYILRGLQPETEYIISFGYNLINKESGDIIEIIDDMVSIKTNRPNYDLKVNKITYNKIYFYLKCDDEYKIDSGVINLYSDKKLVATKEINYTELSNGYEDYFNNSDLGYEIEIKLENLMYNGQEVDLDVQTKYINN